MFEQFIYDISILSGDGFLGTRAILSIDLLISFLVSLPVLVTIAILFVSKGYLRTHKFLQILLFLITLLTLVSFGYIVHYEEGLASLIEKSSIGLSQVYLSLTIHILVASIMLIKWFLSITHATSDYNRRALPGLYSKSHARSGRLISLLIFLTTLSSVGVYWTLFVA